MGVSSPRVIVLNGASSAGKSTIAAALQSIMEDLWLHVGVDAFISFLPLALPERQVQINVEFPTVARGIHAAMAALAREGNRVIIDHVLTLPGSAEELADALEGIPTSWVGVFCPLEILEQREGSRGDRQIGLARSQIDIVHRELSYDLALDTSQLDPVECAVRIKAHLAG